VGGIKEKAVAALRGDIKRVILPVANQPELELLPQEVLDGVAFSPVENMDEVLDAALAPKAPVPEKSVSPELPEASADPGVQLSQ
jgi:ATP-dependent Lon protease